MKKTSKIFSVVLALVLVFAMAIPAFAADDGKITINNAVAGADYKIYKMLDFVASNNAGTQGIYTIESGWEDFFAAAPATNYFVVTDNAGQKTVALKEGVTTVDQTLAKAAIAYAEKNTIAATKTAKASGTKVEFTGLDLGYYAIDTSLGTLCALTNTNSDFTATEKNTKPDIDKFVQEDKDSSWGKVNDADIDQVVNYRSVITVGVGATNYVMHDTMTEGLTFDPKSVVVKYVTVADDGTVTDGAEIVAAGNYTVVENPTDKHTDNHTFDVIFENTLIESLAQGTKFAVYYSATLNENAIIVDEGNDNEVYLSYGEDSTWETDKHVTRTFTWKFDALKYTNNDAVKTPLAGAKFQLLDKDNKVISFTQIAGTNTYKVDAQGTITEIVTDSTGKFEFVGLDEGTYKLHETEAPAGYNKLANDVEITVASEHKDAELKASYTVNGSAATDDAEIEVENKTGGLLPETGGIGTTIFYVVGLALVLGAAVLLITKKRMTCEA